MQLLKDRFHIEVKKRKKIEKSSIKNVTDLKTNFLLINRFQSFKLLHIINIYLDDSTEELKHRRRIYTGKKAKVVAAVFGDGTRSIPCHTSDLATG